MDSNTRGATWRPSSCVPVRAHVRVCVCACACVRAHVLIAMVGRMNGQQHQRCHLASIIVCECACARACVHVYIRSQRARSCLCCYHLRSNCRTNIFQGCQRGHSRMSRTNSFQPAIRGRVSVRMRAQQSRSCLCCNYLRYVGRVGPAWCLSQIYTKSGRKVLRAQATFKIDAFAFDL